MGSMGIQVNSCVSVGWKSLMPSKVKTVND